jgi:hypothetical protein
MSNKNSYIYEKPIGCEVEVIVAYDDLYNGHQEIGNTFWVDNKERLDYLLGNNPKKIVVVKKLEED